MRDHEDVRRLGCRLAAGLAVAILFTYTIVFANVQLFDKEKRADRAQKLADRRAMKWARRGSMLDRDGHPLNVSLARYQFVLHPEQICDPRRSKRQNLNRLQSTIAEFSAFVGRERFYYERPSRNTLSAHLRLRAPLPIVLFKNVDEALQRKWDTVGALRFPDVALERYFIRQYCFPHIAPLLRGKTESFYRRSTSENAFKFNYCMDMNGLSGIERACNGFLRGVPGCVRIGVDSRGYRHYEIIEKAPVAGQDLTLSISLPLQCAAEYLLEGLDGCIVVMHVPTGDILVLASSPEPALNLSPEKRHAFLEKHGKSAGDLKPIFTPYPLGSIMKPITAIAGLVSGVITPETTFICDGGFRISRNHTISCVRTWGHGPQNLVTATTVSCNDYYCTCGSKTGIELLAHWAGQFGLGQYPGTILGSKPDRPAWDNMETRGFIPTVEQMAERHGRRPYPGETPLVAIGQGPIDASVLQIVAYVRCLADGRYLPPRLVLNVPGDMRSSRDLGIPKEHLAAVLQAMIAAVEEPNGTARRAAIPGVTVAAKTGTAEYNKPDGSKGKCCWTIALAPVERPEYAVACVIRNGDSGGKTAAPIVRKILTRALDRQELFASAAPPLPMWIRK